MNVYEVELETGIPGYRVLRHVRAVDEQQAREKAQALHPDWPVSPHVTLRRPCTKAEIKEAVAS
jgi:hypothetical protein